MLKNRAYLLAHLEPKYIIEELYSNEVLNEREYQNVKSKTNDREQCVLILNYISVCEVSQFFKFCDILKEDYDWVQEKIVSDAKEAGIIRNDAENQKSEQLSDDLQNLNPSEKDLMLLSKELSKHDWEEVIFLLGISSIEIERSKRLSSPTLQCMSLLVIWKRKQGLSSTFSQLADAIGTANVSRSCMKKLIEVAKQNKNNLLGG